jgi:hypothetical protein
LFFTLVLVPGMGLEPIRLTAHAPQTCLSTNSNTRANSFAKANIQRVVKQKIPPNLVGFL